MEINFYRKLGEEDVKFRIRAYLDGMLRDSEREKQDLEQAIKEDAFLRESERMRGPFLNGYQSAVTEVKRLLELL